MAAQFEGLTQETADFAAMNLVGVLASAAIGTQAYELIGDGESTSGIPAFAPDGEGVRLPRELFAGGPEYEKKRIQDPLRVPLGKILFLDLHQPPYERPPLMDYEKGTSYPPYGSYYDNYPYQKASSYNTPASGSIIDPSSGLIIRGTRGELSARHQLFEDLAGAATPPQELPAPQEEPEQQGEING